MPIVLLTDFGLTDHYVGVMKGVISGIAPDAPVIDLSHGVPKQDVRVGAITLLQSYKYFPVGTIFCVVVDPGVGTARRPIAVQAGGYWFVGPDNGVLSYTLYNLPKTWAVDITYAMGEDEPFSNTFHGRDLFAPVAALIYAGAPMETLGDPVHDMVGLEPPKFEVRYGWLHGEVLTIDHYGNVMTSLGLMTWTDADTLRVTPLVGEGMWTVRASTALVEAGGTTVNGIQRTYGGVNEGSVLALVGSSGFLEIAVNQGSAAVELGLMPDGPVRLKLGEG